MKKIAGSSLAEMSEATAKSGLFADFDTRFSKEVLARGKPQPLRPGEVLFHQGERGDAAFVLVDGELEVLVDIGTGQVCVAVLRPFQLVGELAILADQVRSATVVAKLGSTLLRIGRQDLLDIAAKPARGRAIIADLGRRLATVNKPLAFLSAAVQLLRNDEVDAEALARMAEDVGNLGPFADSFAFLMREVRTKQERQQDMAMARRIQLSLLPTGLTQPQDAIAIKGFVRPMKEVGGDLYDYFMIDKGRLAIIMADVSGKGVPASLFMVMLRTLIRAVATPSMGPGQVLARANALLAEDNDACMFVTVFFAVLDIETGRLDYVNAGHNPGYLVGSGQACRPLPANGPAVGMLAAPVFESVAVQMHPQDRLFLYTDGVTEAFSTSHDQYGEARLERLLESQCHVPVDEWVAAVVADVDGFAAGQDQFDDITCLALAFRP